MKPDHRICDCDRPFTPSPEHPDERECPTCRRIRGRRHIHIPPRALHWDEQQRATKERYRAKRMGRAAT